METVQDLQTESPYNSIKAMIMTVAMDNQVTHMYESHHVEPSTSGRILGLFDEDYSYMEEIQELLNNEGSQDDTYEFPPPKI
ncbi:hypothetical protein TorRG33x02_042780, partial [Trema orientale]